MKRFHIFRAVAGGVPAALILVPLLSGATVQRAHAARGHLYHVTMGVDSSAPLLGVYKAVPDRLVIHVGDSVQWANPLGNEPQTVTFGPFDNTPALIVHTSEINPQVVQPQGGHVVGDATQNVYSSGALMSGVHGLPSSYTFTFRTPGVYLYRSLFHPPSAPREEIDVVPAGRAASGDVIDRGAAMFDALKSAAQALRSEQDVDLNAGAVSTNYLVYAGIGNDNVSINKFTPAGLTIKAGSTVTWVLREVAGDPHAIVFNNPTHAEQDGQVKLYTRLTRDGGLGLNQSYVKPSLVSGSQVTTTTLQQLSNNRWTSGLLYGSSVNYPSQVPSSYALTFVAPGTYSYVDPFHPGMAGTITVTP